ncbi:ATP-binding protein [Lyngbya aestuarii]|uniref:ATP-binding protein n=1 Tax=Lyngbya aestuarii TaxID=118322 RepID=UPI00403DC26F
MSSIEELIKSKNPFAGHSVVRPLQIWGKGFPDVPSINAHASDAVFDAVAKVRRGERQTVGITITAEKGLGKSHIISRIRHHYQANSDALFVYMSKYDNLNQIKAKFINNVTTSLRAFGSQGVMQWQEIAAALINEAKNWNYTPKQYIASFPNWLRKYSNKLVDRLTNLVLQVKPDIDDPYIVTAILWTLSPSHAPYATHWLSGLELSQTQAETMGLPNPKREDREVEAFNKARQILDIISDYRVPIICFDELDSLDIDENGFTLAQLIASLTKDLYNTLKRGVFLLAMYAETWTYQVRVLPNAEAAMARLVSERTDMQPLKLGYLNSDNVIDLVSHWLKEFYGENQQKPPYPLYPFDESKLRDMGKQKPTLRSVIRWCAENFKLADNRKPQKNIVELCFETELDGIKRNIDVLSEENNNEIAEALKLAFSTLRQQTIEGVTIDEVKEIQGNSQGYIHFKIVGTENKQAVKIGVAVLEQSGGRYQGAALKRLIDYERFDLTRGCLVRSKTINPGARVAQQCVGILLTEKGGEWVLLQEQDIKPLLAILSVYQNRESYELSEEQIFDFIEQKKLAINNPLIREILSDPSGQEPDNLTDEDLPMRVPQNVSDVADGIELNV